MGQARLKKWASMCQALGREVGGIYDIPQTPQEYIHEFDYLSSAKVIILITLSFTTAEESFC